jgi:hypothetical protein
MAPLVGTLEVNPTKKEVSSFLRREWESATTIFIKRGVLVSGLLLGYPWQKLSLIRMLFDMSEDDFVFERGGTFAKRFLKVLGSEGQAEYKRLEDGAKQKQKILTITGRSR